MLLSLFVLFNCIVLGLIIAGVLSDMAILKLGAFTLMFLVGVPFLLGSGIEYQSGSTITTTNGTSVETYTYTSYQNHWAAFFYEMLSIIGFVGVMMTSGGKNDYDD